jgi:hypothetical protein
VFLAKHGGALSRLAARKAASLSDDTFILCKFLRDFLSRQRGFCGKKA